MMDTKSKTFFTLLLLIIMGSVALTYRRAVILNDFERVEGGEVVGNDL